MREKSFQHTRESSHKQRLADTRRSFTSRVMAGEDGDQSALDNGVLPK